MLCAAAIDCSARTLRQGGSGIKSRQNEMAGASPGQDEIMTKLFAM
jgi:hypothetical protein